MSYREKTAWLTLVCMVIAYTVYFTIFAVEDRLGPPVLKDILWTFGLVTVVQAAVVVIGSIVLAVRSSSEARVPPDERDRAIARRGASAAYYVLLIETILVGVVMPFSEPAWKIVNAALLALVIAEAVRHILVVLSYRRGWHG